MRDANLPRGTEWTEEKINPRLGIVWKPAPMDTLRAAAFRYLLPVISARLDPTIVAGVPMLRDDREGTLESGLNLVWEREWEDGFLSSDLFFRERELSVDDGSGNDPAELETIRDRRHGLELKWNQLIWRGAGLAAGYRYLDTSDRLSPQMGRREHLASIELRYQDPRGFFGGLGQIYRHIRSEDEDRPREDIFVTDLSVGYRFPGRRGTLALRVGNLFDEKYNWVTDPFDVSTGRTPRREIFATLSVNF
jgi:outer membrane receptor protein involved in Fe transport